MPAGSLLTLGHTHEIPRRLDGELLAFVITDDRGFIAARAAAAAGAVNDLLDARQMFRQRLAPWMRLAFAFRNRLAPRFRFHFVARGARFFFGQQLQLQIAERFAPRTPLLNPPLPQFLFA